MVPRNGRTVQSQNSGVALILVMLALLVLTMLAAAMVFNARSETFASYNFRIGTQAEYVAKAGVQKALNFFNSSSYVPLPPGSATAYYAVSTYSNNPVSLYFSNATAVNCLSGCNGGANSVKLGTSSGTSVYAPTSATASVDVVANWVAAMNNQTISDGVGGSGQYTVTATLLEYHTVNNAFFGVAATAPGCSSDTSASLGICRQPYEVWQVKSSGKWNSNVGAGAAQPTVEMVATIAPMFVPYFADALYGLCKVTASGNTCTDSYNSAAGNYGGSVGSCATTSTTTGNNVSASSAGLGSNGGITLNGNSLSIGGNVTFADATGNSSCDTGFQGSSSGVVGSVLPGPAVPTPPTPDMSTWGYTGTPPTNSSAPSAAPPSSGGGINYRVTNVYMNQSTPPVIPPAISCPLTGYTGYLVKYTVKESTGAQPHTYTYGNMSCTGLTGSGTSTDAYRLADIDASGSGTRIINLIAPANGVANPSYLAANSATTGTNGSINISVSAPLTPASNSPTPYNPTPPVNTNSAIVLDVGDSVSIGGTASINYNSATPGVPSPDFLKMNILGTSSTALSMTGQADLSAMISVPNGTAFISGSGAGGVFFGSILAKTVTDSGTYAVHYDLSMRSQSGSLYTARIVSVTRPKY